MPFLLFCYVGPLVYHTNQTSASQALFSPDNVPPGNGHPLGTDSSGFDILGRLMSGHPLLVGFVVVAAIASVFGALYGAISGFFGSWLDPVLMRIVDAFLSIPVLFLAIVLATVFRPSLTVFILVIAFVSWLIPARLIRGQALSLRQREYVQAVRVMGGSRTRIVLRHIIPNSIGTIIVNATFNIADAILLLAALGFIGLGVPATADRLGLHAVQRCQLRPGRLLVGDLPRRALYRAGGRRLQLHRGRLAGRVGGPPQQR